MTVYRQDDLNLRNRADYVKKSFTSVDTDLNSIISELNSDVSGKSSNITTHKTSPDHDSRYYTETEIDDKITDCLLDSETGEKKYKLGYARLLNPMFHLPMKNNLSIHRGTGSISYSDDVFNTTTNIDRYGNFSIDTAYDVPKFNEHGFYAFYDYLPELYSTSKQDFSDSHWDNEVITAGSATKNITVTTNIANEPSDNYTEVDKIAIANAYNTRKYFLSQSPSYHYTDRPYTFSVFAQKRESNYLYLGFLTDSSTTYGKFNLDTGDCSIYSGEGTVRATRVVDGAGGDDWYRCELTALSSVSGTIIEALICIGSPTGELEYSNSSTTSGQRADMLYLWGAQLDAYAAANSYMYVDGSGNLSDGISSLSIPIENVPSDMSDDGWTFVCDLYTIEYPHRLITDRMIYDIWYTSTVHHSLGINNGRILVDDDDVWSANTTDSDDQRFPTGIKRIIHVRKPGSQQLYINGHKFKDMPYTQHAYDGTHNMTIKYTLNAHISNIRFYDFPITEEEARIA